MKFKRTIQRTAAVSQTSRSVSLNRNALRRVEDDTAAVRSDNSRSDF